MSVSPADFIALRRLSSFCLGALVSPIVVGQLLAALEPEAGWRASVAIAAGLAVLVIVFWGLSMRNDAESPTATAAPCTAE